MGAGISEAGSASVRAQLCRAGPVYHRPCDAVYCETEMTERHLNRPARMLQTIGKEEGVQHRLVDAPL